MSLQVYLSNVAQRLPVELNLIPSPEALKEWIAQHAGIPTERQILMTAKGKNVKQQHLLSEGEIFVYDKTSLATGTATIQASEAATVPHLADFPTTLEDEQTLVAWQELFAARRAWALEVADIIRQGVIAVDEKVEESEVLERCMQVALENLQNHFLSLQQAATRTQAWAKDTVSEHQEVLRDWKHAAETLSELPVRDDIAQLLSTSRLKSMKGNKGTMSELLETSDLETAASQLTVASAIFEQSLGNLDNDMSTLRIETEKAMALGRVEWPVFDTEGVVQEIEAMAVKASRDYEDVLKATDQPRSIAAVSRQAIRHTSELLPAIAEMGREITRMVEDANDHRTRMSETCQKSLKEISRIQSQFAGMHARISNLKVGDDGQLSLDVLDKIFRLPTVYGSTIVEAVHRNEWHEKTQGDLDTLREEISQLKDDEIRRRKKWVSSLADFVKDEQSLNDDILDFNLSISSSKWPAVSRDEISAYVDDLKALHLDEAVQQVMKFLKQLNTSAKPKRATQSISLQSSIHGLDQSLLKDGALAKATGDDKLRLEEKLRASESRIRKLEDLLHRQSQMARPSSGLFTPQTDMERRPSSPGFSIVRPTEVQSRRPSVSTRRLSNQQTDEKAMIQRIATLEAHITKLQEEAHAERRSSTESRDKMQEAESVKRDLLANFESQRQEFDKERQMLEDETNKLKIRLEDIEDELDQALDSREHHRITQDQLVSNLRSEMDRLRRTMGEEIDSLKRSKERLQADYASNRERVSSLERQLQHTKEEKSSLQSHNLKLANSLRATEDKRQEHLVSLQAAHSSLTHSSSAPEDFDRLISAIEVLAEGAAIHSRGQDDTLQLANAENKSLSEKHSRLERLLQQSVTDLEVTRKKVTEAFDENSELRNKLNVVRVELEDERKEIQNLRSKFAAGETGSDELKSRLSEQEARIADLLEKLGEKDAQIEGLRNESETLTIQAQSADKSLRAVQKHFDARSKKAHDLTQRLFQHHNRVIRMLESFGYVITRQADALVLQRASKVSASTTLSVDGASPMKRTISNPVTTPHYSEPSDLEGIYWTTEEDVGAEDAKYEAFITAVTRLDVDASMEVMTKRYKDMEAAAKKYQKDSRANRDRCNRLQSEAHDKIAYRSFKEGDLALFLPTRNQATKPWAAFNVGAPHRFLREQDAHSLQSRDWLLARINKVEERVVDLSRSLSSTHERSSLQVEGSDGGSMRSVEDENPFELSDGLRWYYIDATEEKPGAPSTPGLGKSTAAASVVDVKGHMSRRSLTGKDFAENSAVNAAKTLSKSLDSRRSSEASRKSGNVAALRAQGSNTSGIHAAASAATSTGGTDGLAEGRMSTATPSVRPSDDDARTSNPGAAREDAQVFDVGQLDTTTVRGQDSQNTSARQSPLRHSAHPVKRVQDRRSPSSSPAKKPWERLFSLEYRG